MSEGVFAVIFVQSNCRFALMMITWLLSILFLFSFLFQQIFKYTIFTILAIFDRFGARSWSSSSSSLSSTDNTREPTPAQRQELYGGDGGGCCCCCCRLSDEKFSTREIILSVFSCVVCFLLNYWLIEKNIELERISLFLLFEKKIQIFV